MKKILTIACAALMMSMAACTKDKDNNGENSSGRNTGGGGNQPQTEQGDGIYNPAVKIDRIHYSDTTPDEVWQWQDDRVMSIYMATANGSEEAGISFDYTSEGRISEVYTTVLGAQVDASLGYNSQKLITSVSATGMGIDLASVQVSHNAQKKVNHISVDLNDEVITTLVQLVTMMMGDSTGILPFLSPAPASKLTIDDKAFDADIMWTGDNATRMIVNAHLNMTTTLNEIPTDILQAMAGEDYADMVELALQLMGNTPIPIEVTIADTVDYAYDNRNNPLQGFLGRVSVAALSANNITSIQGHGSANLSANISLGMMGSLPLNQSIPLNEMGQATYSYTYTSDGWPHIVTDGEGVTTEYIYKD